MSMPSRFEMMGIIVVVAVLILWIVGEGSLLERSPRILNSEPSTLNPQP